MLNKYQLKLKSININKLNTYLIFLKKILTKLNVHYTFIVLPKQKKCITLLKSPHVYKKAREQFLLKKYSVLITMFSKITPSLYKFLSLNKPFEIKLNLRKIA